MVLSAEALLKEINQLEARGVPVRERLKISSACPLILPYHVALDQAREAKRGEKKLGQLAEVLARPTRIRLHDADFALVI